MVINSFNRDNKKLVNWQVIIQTGNERKIF